MSRRLWLVNSIFLLAGQITIFREGVWCEELHLEHQISVEINAVKVAPLVRDRLLDEEVFHLFPFQASSNSPDGGGLWVLAPFLVSLDPFSFVAGQPRGIQQPFRR